MSRSWRRKSPWSRRVKNVASYFGARLETNPKFEGREQHRDFVLLFPLITLIATVSGSAWTYLGLLERSDSRSEIVIDCNDSLLSRDTDRDVVR